jgi:hypothetical protein
MLKRAVLKLWHLASAIWLDNFVALALLYVYKKSVNKKTGTLYAGFFVPRLGFSESKYQTLQRVRHGLTHV